MGDSSSFSSLFALVDNHLSKSNLDQESQPTTSGLGSFKLPSLNVQRGSSDTGLASSAMKFPIPSFSSSEHPINNTLTKQTSNLFQSASSDETVEPSVSMSDCPINDVLATQLSNMFKAREVKEEKERLQALKLVEENIQKQKLVESSCLIDLMPAVQLPGQVRPHQIETLSSSSSTESLVMPDATDSVQIEQQENLTALELLARPASPLKPITTDMSYILKHKIGKCSEFGKVLCARYRPVAAPYFRIHIQNKDIKVFDFSTPSPDDINLERWKKPSYYGTVSNTVLTGNG